MTLEVAMLLLLGFLGGWLVASIAMWVTAELYESDWRKKFTERQADREW
jgi:hypothetical protein